MAVRKDRDTKAELNRRSQACDVLTGTGISRRVNGGRVGALRRPDAAARRPYQKWTSIRVARPVFRFGRPACVSQHLCPGNGLPAEAAQVGSKPTFAKATAGSLRPPRCRGRRLESRAGVAPASAVLQTAAYAARPTGWRLKARASAFALAPHARTGHAL